jgi:hypothetical protein
MDLVSRLRSGPPRLAVDAIVLDATAGNALRGGAVAQCIAVAEDVRKVSTTMPTGVRWGAVPIAVIVSNEAVASTVRYFGLPERLVICRKDAGWQTVYHQIASEVLSFVLDLVQQMRTLGWDIAYYRGRWVRVQITLPRRRRGFFPDLESELYDGTRDLWFKTEDRVVRRQLKLVGSGATRTVEDILELQRLIVGGSATEPALQQLIESAPYLLRASQMELHGRRAIVDARTGDRKIPDVVTHPFFTNAIDITELKLPTATLAVKRGKLVYQSAGITEGIAQVRDYAEVAIDTSNRSQIEAIFGEPVAINSQSLVIGISAGVDPDDLAKIRSQIPDVDVQGWDEILDDAIVRYGIGLERPT